MTVLSVLTQIGALADVAIAMLVVALVAGFGYRRFAGADSIETNEAGSRTPEGPPLESWRHVYDVDKAEADREITAVQQQARDLAEADDEARR